MKTAAATVKDYLDSLPADRREPLIALRRLIKRIWPKITEDMSHGMPTFRAEGHALYAIASQKHFMALYVMHYDLLLPFKHDLMVHDHGKSCIRFKRLDAATLDLFDRIIKYTGSQMATSRYYGRTENLRSNGKAR